MEWSRLLNDKKILFLIILLIFNLIDMLILNFIPRGCFFGGYFITFFLLFPLFFIQLFLLILSMMNNKIEQVVFILNILIFAILLWVLFDFLLNNNLA